VAISILAFSEEVSRLEKIAPCNQLCMHLSCNSLKNKDDSFMYLPHLHRVICSGQIGRPSVKDAAFLSVRL
jgi:hypothetical protein